MEGSNILNFPFQKRNGIPPVIYGLQRLILATALFAGESGFYSKFPYNVLFEYEILY
jgi:hypothetical protein